MRVRTLLILTAGLLVAGEKPKEDEVKKEMAKLQGTWVMVAAESGGKLAKDIEIRGRTLEIKGDVAVFKSKDAVVASSFKLDPAKKPKVIDFVSTDSKGNPSVRRGIYALDGDELKICNGAPGEARPTEFATPKGSKTSLYILKREKP